MTDTLKLKAAIVLSGKSRQEIADELGISLYTLFKKIHNKSEFRASEINKLEEILKLDNKEEIFFANISD